MTPDNLNQESSGAETLARALSNGRPEQKLGSSWVYGLHHPGCDQGGEPEGSNPSGSHNLKTEEK